MACSNPINQLINKVLDQETTEQEYHDFEEHILACKDCRERFEQLRETEQLLRSIKKVEVPDYFTEKVMQQIVRSKKESRLIIWLKKHPFGTAAALFIVLMAGYIFSLWEQTPFHAEVQGSGEIAYEDHQTVIVPKGEVIKGDLIVQNGKVKIEGKVDGDVILIHSDSLLASAGHVTGDIKEVNQILEWIWYHLKQIFNKVFFIILPGEKGIGVPNPLSF